ncbi:C2H2-type domain-containing protein [Fusarium keratoplasticum]|uniref:C2H2-type domain-containing protein n=1 Tax=Fusarium keratoplasticum TaxID=1328300 RepID=A0ACC0R416_9HYPO|nr:C2H2-type domain-containing protein [Fusarium keratoplasticum]KAI8674512.1 C2H2-type domain-containing protein [Fusarium keratoplasticum]
MAQPTDLPAQKPRKRGAPRIRADSSKAVQAILERNRSKPALEKGAGLHKKTLALQNRVWKEWTQFVEAGKLDSDETWLQLCAGSHDAVNIFESFLEMYILNSETSVPCLGPDEYKTKRDVNSAATLQDVWSALVRVANDDVLKQFRYQPNANAQHFTLRYSTRGGVESGPAGLVGKLIPGLADRLGLTRRQQFVKKETTEEDLLLVLQTAWERASDILCKPSQRVSFSGNVILGGIGGWRYESLRRVKYKDIEVGWLRDPADPTKVRPVASVHVRHVKRHEDEIERDQSASLTFGITRVPVKSICLLSHIVAMAIYNGAFATKFTSCEEVLYPKNLLEDHIDYVPLKWKDDIVDQPVFPLDYKLYWRIWHRVLEVAGLREGLRPYSIRVGAGGRLNGALEPALRSYIMGNTEEVFRKSYNPVDQRHSLMTVAYKELTGGCDEVIAKLHQSFTKRDCYAPIYISEEDWKGFESRNDITQWRKELNSLPNRSSKEAKRIQSRIQYVKKVLEKELIKQRRDEYFETADRLRSEGQSTTHLQERRPRRPGPKQNELSSRMAEDLSPLFLAEDSTKRFADELVSEVFQKPFYCRECEFSGRKQLVAAGLSAWSNHVEQCHGKLHAPNPVKPAHCLLCDKTFSAGGFSLHLNRSHVQLGYFETSFPCPECRRLGTGDLITSLDQWILHVRDIHDGGTVPGAIVVGVTNQKPRKRKTEELNQYQQIRTKQLCLEAIVKDERGEGSCGITSGDYHGGTDFWDKDELADWDRSTTGGSCHASEEFWVTGRDEDY